MAYVIIVNFVIAIAAGRERIVLCGNVPRALESLHLISATPAKSHLIRLIFALGKAFVIHRLVNVLVIQDSMVAIVVMPLVSTGAPGMGDV